MDGITYDVRIYKPQICSGSKYTTYYVRWRVAKAERRRRFSQSAQAESFRSDLLAAARKGEAFDLDTGEPTSWGRRARQEVTWYALACRFVDM